MRFRFALFTRHHSLSTKSYPLLTACQVPQALPVCYPAVPGRALVIAVQAGADVAAFASESDVAAFASAQIAASRVAERAWAPAAQFAAPAEAADAEPGLYYDVVLQALYFAAAGQAFRFVGSAPVSVFFPGLTALRVADSWSPVLPFAAESLRCLAPALPVDSQALKACLRWLAERGGGRSGYTPAG